MHEAAGSQAELSHAVLGLKAFLDDPLIPLNKSTERALRGMVTGRKNHYGERASADASPSMNPSPVPATPASCSGSLPVASARPENRASTPLRGRRRWSGRGRVVGRRPRR